MAPMLMICLVKPLPEAKVGCILEVKEFKKKDNKNLLITKHGTELELPKDFGPSYYKPAPVIRHDMEGNHQSQGYQLRKPDDLNDEDFAV